MLIEIEFMDLMNFSVRRWAEKSYQFYMSTKALRFLISTFSLQTR